MFCWKGRFLSNGDERIELCRGKYQESTVLHSAPTHLDRGLYRMSGQRAAQTAGYRFVKHPAHPRRDVPLLPRARLLRPHATQKGNPPETLPRKSFPLSNRTSFEPEHGCP